MRLTTNAAYRVGMVAMAAITGISIFFYSEYTNRNYFRDNVGTIRHLQSLQTDFHALESEVLRCESFLYYNYDAMHRLIRSIRHHLQELRSSSHLQGADHRESYRKILTLISQFDKYRSSLEDYLTLNASLKNSVVYIPNLHLRAYRLFDPSRPSERGTLTLLSKISSTVLLTKDTMDKDFLAALKSYTDNLENEIPRYEGPRKRLLDTLFSHITEFEKIFPVYIKIFNRLQHSPLTANTTAIQHRFQEESRLELMKINDNNQFMLLLYLISLGIIIYYIVHTQKENRHLQTLRKNLEKMLITDSLTGLKNRLAYQQKKKELDTPALILINIDHFTHINGFYGARIGDEVLKKFSEKLREATPSELRATLYRLGGDDFGILFDLKNSRKRPESLISHYQELPELHHIKVNELSIDLNFTIGISTEKNRLFETADMALKHARTLSQISYAVYSPLIDKRDVIEENIRAIREIRSALSENRLVPHYQPICSLKDHNTSKYEALARIERPDLQKTLKPDSFINVAKEAKQSGKITSAILEKTLQMAQKHPFVFSVNLTAGDIENIRDYQHILNLLEQYKSTARQIIFEIVESEEIRDYKIINRFINTVKRYGCRIAIDDFGSGYSNFEKILKMDIDLLKIDGSLIRRIDHDRHSELIVKTILDFALYAGFETVAEYVHSKAIYDKVIELGFDYAQGNYIGEASRGLQLGGCKLAAGKKTD